MTIGRMMDITYRLNVGLLSFSMEKMKDLADPAVWVSFLEETGNAIKAFLDKTMMKSGSGFFPDMSYLERRKRNNKPRFKTPLLPKRRKSRVSSKFFYYRLAGK